MPAGRDESIGGSDRGGCVIIGRAIIAPTAKRTRTIAMPTESKILCVRECQNTTYCVFLGTKVGCLSP